MEGYSSGQRGQTVNLLAMPSEVRILPPPPFKVVKKSWELTRVLEESGGCSSMVEPQPSKLIMWVRSPSPAPIFRLGAVGEEPGVVKPGYSLMIWPT